MVLGFTLPNVLFFTLIADQAIYPFLFTLTLLLTIKTTQNPHYFLPSLLGLLLYIDCFISFSLIPAIGFVGIWFILNYWVGQKDTKKKLLKQGLVVAANFLVVYLLVMSLSGYNPWIRCQNAFSNHRAIKQFQLSPGGILSSIIQNHFEFFYWIGIPIGVLWIKNIYSSFKNFFQGVFTPQVLFGISTAIIWGILSITSQTRAK